MTTETKHKWWDFYMDQIRFCETIDLEGIRSHYTEDAQVLSFNYQIFGRDAIVKHFDNYLHNIVKGVKLKSTDQYLDTDDSVYLEGTLTTDAGEAKVYDIFTMKDGLIHRHFTGLIGFTPKQS